MYCWKPPPSDAIVVGCTAIGVTTSVSLLRRNGTTCTSIVADSIGEGDHAVTHDPMLWQKKKEQWQRTNKSKNRSIHVRNLVFQFFWGREGHWLRQTIASFSNTTQSDVSLWPKKWFCLTSQYQMVQLVQPFVQGS